MQPQTPYSHLQMDDLASGKSHIVAIRLTASQREALLNHCIQTGRTRQDVIEAAIASIVHGFRHH